MSITAAAFASDAITLGDRLTINAGVRFDHSRAISQDLPALDAQGRETGTIIPGLGTLYTWNICLAAAGRHREAHRRWPDDAARELRTIQPGRADRRVRPFHPGVTRHDDHAFDPATGGYTRSSRCVDPKTNLLLDPDIRAPRTDEYSVGVDREIGRRLAVAIAYVRKDGANFIGWTDVAGQYREETRHAGRRPQRAGVRARSTSLRRRAAFC